MKCINVERTQYGVGQGCFHGQELIYGEENNPPSLTVRFVYDCGSSSSKKVLNFAISHFTEGVSHYPIDAIYLSHFEYDHINGLESLCRSAAVERIYVPYLTPLTALQVIARASALDSDAEEVGFVASLLVNILGTGTAFGVPVLMVRGAQEGYPRPFPEGNERDDLDGPGYVDFPPVDATDRSVSDKHPVTIRPSAGSPAKSALWEIVPWFHASDPRLTKATEAEIIKIPGWSAAVLEGFRSDATAPQTEATLTWINNNFASLADAYIAAIKVHNSVLTKEGKPSISEDHNVASLCVYSGPSTKPKVIRISRSAPVRPYEMRHFDCDLLCAGIKVNDWGAMPNEFEYDHSPDHTASWIATGDALLEDLTVWTEFEKHFGRARLATCGTVMIPHHGSGKGGNFNYRLATHANTCVISAGSNNPYRHPGRPVLREILAAGSAALVLTEGNPLGLTEFIGLLP